MNIKHLNSVIALLIATSSACVDTEAEPEPPMATLAASDHTTTDLGVTSWDVATEGEQVRVIGRDASGERKVEMVVEQDAATPDDRARIETVFPDHRTFELTRTGAIDGADSDYARLLGEALYSDLGHRTTPVTASPGAGLGSVSSAIVTRSNGQIYMGWSMFGYSGYQDVGDWCQDTTRSEASTAVTSYGVAWQCELDWRSPIVTDCRARIRYSISGFHYDTCNWWVFVN